MGSYQRQATYMQHGHKLTVAIADDHAIVREGLRTILQQTYRIVGEAADGVEALKLAERLRPEAFVVDMMMPGLNGLEVIRQMKQRLPCTKTIVLSMNDTKAHIAQAIMNGAHGYIFKQNSSSELVKAIEVAVEGGYYFSHPICEDEIRDYIRETAPTTVEPYDTLTDREREVMQLVVQGQTSHEIGEKLNISPRTVEIHRAKLIRKLGCANRSELVCYAVKLGIIG